VGKVEDMVRILIGGDFCPIGRAESLFVRGEVEKIFHDLLEEFERSDLSIVNLECPLIKESSPGRTAGPILGARGECMKGIKQAGIDIVNLANNHIMDHKEQGFVHTLKMCEENGVAYVGGGVNRQEARKILVREIQGIRVGVLGVSEWEFSIAGETSVGANPLDVIDIVRNIQSTKGEIDFLLVLVHGGNEHYQYPRPGLRDMCRFLVEQGAGAVVCQHSHCVGCYEVYKDALIVYGQGNLIFDWERKKDMSWEEGFLVRLEIESGNKNKWEIVPYTKAGEGPGKRRMGKNEQREFREDWEERSRLIKEGDFLEKKWQEFCQEKKQEYMGLLNANNFLMQKVSGKVGFLQRLYGRKAMRKKLNLIRCESHREAMVEILSKISCEW